MKHFPLLAIYFLTGFDSCFAVGNIFQGKFCGGLLIVLQENAYGFLQKVARLGGWSKIWAGFDVEITKGLSKRVSLQYGGVIIIAGCQSCFPPSFALMVIAHIVESE